MKNGGGGSGSAIDEVDGMTLRSSMITKRHPPLNSVAV